MSHNALEPYLEDLEARIDPGQEDRLIAAWARFLDQGAGEELFYPEARRPCPSRIEWPSVHINDALGDYDAMALQQLAGVSGQLNGGSAALNIRCNYGTGILPCLFGCELFVMDRALQTLPTARPLGSVERVRALVAAGVPDLRGALGEKVFTCAQRLVGAFRAYPRIDRYVDIYHPDVQGPIDVAEVTWGSDLFYAFYEDAALLRDFLALITETYIAFMRVWYGIVPPRQGPTSHWGLMHRGRLMLRNDSLMNVSPEAYVEFVRPWDQRLFDEFGGGAMHFCGRGSHYIEAMSEMRGLTGVNLSQPHLNDMETIFRNTVDKGIRLLGFDRTTAEAAGRPLRGLVQCWR